MNNNNNGGNNTLDELASEMHKAYEDLHKAFRLRNRGIRLVIAGGCMFAAGVVGLILMNRQEEK